MFFGNGDPSHCRDGVERTLGHLPEGKATVSDVRFEDGQALVRAVIEPGVTTATYYFVDVDGSWKLNSIGERHEMP